MALFAPTGNPGMLQLLQRRRFLQQQLQRMPGPQLNSPMQGLIGGGRYGGPGPFNPGPQWPPPVYGGGVGMPAPMPSGGYQTPPIFNFPSAPSQVPITGGGYGMPAPAPSGGYQTPPIFNIPSAPSPTGLGNGPYGGTNTGTANIYDPTTPLAETPGYNPLANLGSMAVPNFAGWNGFNR